MKRAWWLLLLLALNPATAKVEESEAQELRNRLTPLGGERAGNEEGNIPEWAGGYVATPPCYQGAGKRYCDPYDQDKPLYTITARLLPEYYERLSAGQRAMLAKYPDSYRLRVYPTRRSFANPAPVYEAAIKNALEASLGGFGEVIANASLAVPFPIPKSGVETIWNHRLRYQGVGQSRWNNQVAVTASGEPGVIRIREDARYPYAIPGGVKDGVFHTLIQSVVSPERLIGTVTLIKDSLSPIRHPRQVWTQAPDANRLSRARSFGYDSAGTVAEGLRFDDQIDTFSGGSDRYNWRIVGKREMVVPYNAYKLHSDAHRIRDLTRPHHLDPELARYELHRVWVVDAFVRPGITHLYKRRTFYFDEDSWQILLVDAYDSRDQLWRSHEVHTVMAYDRYFLMPIADAIYDLNSGRYLVQGLNNEDEETVETEFPEDFFTPSNARRLVR